MMACLFGEVGDADGFGGARGGRLRCGERIGGRLRRCFVGRFYRGGVVLDLPVTLKEWLEDVGRCWEETDPEELAECGIVWLARLAFDVFLESSQSFDILPLRCFDGLDLS
jgi:hypothetical protein